MNTWDAADWLLFIVGLPPAILLGIWAGMKASHNILNHDLPYAERIKELKR